MVAQYNNRLYHGRHYNRWIDVIYSFIYIYGGLIPLPYPTPWCGKKLMRTILEASMIILAKHSSWYLSACSYNYSTEAAWIAPNSGGLESDQFFCCKLLFKYYVYLAVRSDFFSGTIMFLGLRQLDLSTPQGSCIALLSSASTQA